MQSNLPKFFAGCIFSALLSGCISLEKKPDDASPRIPVIEIRHSEALKEKISPQQTLTIALKFGSLLDTTATAQLEKHLSAELKNQGASAVFLDMNRGGQQDLRKFALDQASPYVVTLFAGTDVVLQGHGSLAANEIIANLFDARTATPLWASLMRLSEADTQASADAIAQSVARALTGELTRIGVLAAKKTEGASALSPSAQAVAQEVSDSSAAAPLINEGDAAPLMVLKVRQAEGQRLSGPVEIRLQERDGAVLLSLEGPVEQTLSHLVLRRPERLVIDLPGLRLEPGEASARVQDLDGHALVARLRASQYQTSVLRIVLDLKRPIEANVLPRSRTPAGTSINTVSLRPQ